jgi:hypothetical protein
MSNISNMMGYQAHLAKTRVAEVVEVEAENMAAAFSSQQNDQNGQKVKYTDAQAASLATITSNHDAAIAANNAAVDLEESNFLTLIDAGDGLTTVPELQAELDENEDDIDAKLVSFSNTINAKEAALRADFGTGDDYDAAILALTQSIFN